MNLVLYTGPQCELCETALSLIYASIPAGSYQLQKTDVTTSLELKKTYGLRIPVLKNTTTGTELDWPFDESQLLEFCELGL